MAKSLGLGVVCAVVMVGCANVKVHKVDVQDRVTGQDDHVKGFRYYLTRPYIAVGKNIPVTTEYLPVGLARTDQGQYYLISETPVPLTGKHEVFDLKGQLRPDVPFESVKPLNAPAGPGQNSLPKAVVDMQQAVVDKVLTKIRATFPAAKLAGVTLDRKVIMEEVAKDAKTKQLLSDKDTFEDGRILTVKVAVNSANASLGSAGLTLDLSKKEDIAELLKEVPSPSGKDAFPPSSGGTRAVFAPTPADPPPVKTADPTKQTTEAPAVQVVFLPDFEEQYAIENCNVLAKTRYQYKFHNGTELESVSGSYNATDVPVKIIETFGKLITAAGEIAKTRAGAAPGGAAKAAYTAGGTQPSFYIKTQRVIEPGVYRVQKSWERAAAAEPVSPARACELFSDLGLPIVESVTIITATEHDDEVKAQQASAGK